MAEILDQKDKFSNAINHYAEEQRSEVEAEIAAYKKKKLEEAENQVLQECYQMIQREMAQMRARISRDEEKREMDSQRALLKRRREITEEVFQRAADKLKSFTAGTEYCSYLEKSARRMAEFFGCPGIVIFLRKEDAGYEDSIRKALGYSCEFKTDASIELGGLRGFQPDMEVSADATFDTLLQDQYEWFEKESGLNIV